MFDERQKKETNKKQQDQEPNHTPSQEIYFHFLTKTIPLISNVIADASFYKPKDYPVKEQYNVLDFH